MNKKELVRELSEKSGLTQKDAEQVLNAFIDTVVESEEDIKIVGFGTFTWRERAGRTGRNPQDPEKEITIPASRNIAFKASKTLKQLI